MNKSPRLGIIVPYRDRTDHLDEFLSETTRFFAIDPVNAGIAPRQARRKPRSMKCSVSAGLGEAVGTGLPHQCLLNQAADGIRAAKATILTNK